MKDINDLLKERSITDYKSITVFDCFNENLTSLKGIEKLVNLEGLYCFNNKLTYIDLSNNVNLEMLYCRNNQLNSQDLYQQIINNKSITKTNSITRERYISNLKYDILEDFKNM